MPDDIKRMAKAEDDIVAIIYHRNDYMGFLGKATVVFKSATTATEFLTQHFGKFMSGHRLSMTMLDPFNNNDKSLIPPQMQPATFSGQAVLVSGLPLATRPDHLRSEFRKFNLMDTTEHAIVPVQSKKMASTCQYLIRLSSPSEAYRFVRTYHNTFYKREEYRRRCPIRATVIY
ncbi:hypothetical protein DFQ27_003814 [Actinomortierella ambigua]|uniref:RRM domain-containing protein n=1 Tax=Actinomortierella ambigua TaxID=1343610 RepID=A0A9P6U5E0_9FUNG|nr:hypothetical protein DFQ27_003814 [Actinomortierella ambigua]